jgi:autotransporter-associated beta strand protein
MTHVFTGRRMATVMVIVAVALLTPAAASAASYRWQTDGNGLWNDPANWQLLSGTAGTGYPFHKDDVAVFAFTITAARTVTIPAGVTITIGTLQISESSNLTIAGASDTSRLRFDSFAAAATLDVFGPNRGHRISATVELIQHLTIDVLDSTSGITFARGIGAVGSSSAGVKKVGSGTLRFDSDTVSNTYRGTTAVEEGSLQISHNDSVIAIPGDFVIGRTPTSPKAAVLDVLGGDRVFAPTGIGRVLPTGFLNLRATTQNLASLSVIDGTVGTSGFLGVNELILTRGRVELRSAQARLRVTGVTTATSNAEGISYILGPGWMLLNHTAQFIVDDGPSEVDLLLDAGITDNGAGLGLTKMGAGVLQFGGANPNAYTGTTWVQSGRLEMNRASNTATVLGTLVVGNAGHPAEAYVTADHTIADAATVSVMAQGLLTLYGVSDTIARLNVNDGAATVRDTQLTVGLLSMLGGTVNLVSATRIVLTGELTAASTAAGTALIGGTADFWLSNPEHLFSVSDGPQAIDLRIDVTIFSPVAQGVRKGGLGVALFTGQNKIRGVTTVEAGTLLVTGSQPESPIVVEGEGLLGGTGTVGPITAGAGTWVSPGLSPGRLSSGALRMDGRSTLRVELQGTSGGAGDDQMRVTGGVTLTNTELSIADGPSISPFAKIILIDNDGTDPIAGTFAGLPEGATVTGGAATGQPLTISYTGGDGNDVVLSATGSVTYFLAEGATGGFFDEDVLIANPNTADAPITVTFLKEGGSTLVRTYTIAKESRLTIRVDEIPELAEASASVKVVSDARLPLTVERTMFWDATHYGGHTSNAVLRAERRWMFAEGSQGFFDTYVLLANANDTATTATITFLLENDAPVVKDVPLPAFARKTVWAGDYSEVRDRSFGIVVDAVDPVIAERAMYFGSVPGKLWTGGHVNTGATAPSTSWFHAEGATGGFFDTFILLSNPQTTPAHVTLRFLLENGGEVTVAKTLDPQTRLTVNPAAEGDPRLERASLATVITSDVPIVSERSMYWGGDASPFGEGHNSSGLVNTATRWGLADGRVGGPESFFTYILLANPAPDPAQVTVTYLREGGATPIVRTYTVPAASRFNIDVGTFVPELQDEPFGARIDVTNSVPIAVERSIYWNANGIFWAGGTNALGTPLP